MSLLAGYVRVSTEQQVEDRSHIKQRQKIEDWANENFDDYELTIYEDNGISGRADEREEYDQLIEDSEQYDAVIVRELSRFGRDLRKVLSDIEELEENDCDFISIKDEDLDTSTAQGQLLFNIIASFNQYWADIASERSQEMIQRRREEGKPIGRPSKLSDAQKAEVREMHREEEYSYSTLVEIVKQKYDIEVSRSTIYKYCDEGESEEGTAMKGVIEGNQQ